MAPASIDQEQPRYRAVVDQLACLSVDELVCTFAELIGRRGTEIASTLRSILTTVDDCGIPPTPPADSSPPDQSQTESESPRDPGPKTDHQHPPTGLLQRVGPSHTSESKTRLDLSPSNSSPKVATEHATPSKRRREPNVSNSVAIKRVRRGKSAEERASLSQHERAVAMTTNAANDFWSTERLKQLWRLLQKERKLKSMRYPGVSIALPEYRGASKQDVVGNLKKLQTSFINVNCRSHMTRVLERYEHVLTAKHFNQCKAAKIPGIGSLYDLFTETLLAKWVEPRELGLIAVGNPETYKQNKWRDEMVSCRCWLQFEELYGCGILALLRDDLTDEHFRQIHKPDKEKMFSDISAHHPTLKEDLKHLTELILYKIEYGELPSWGLRFEMLNEADVFVGDAEDIRALFSRADGTTIDNGIESPQSDLLSSLNRDDNVTDNAICMAERPFHAGDSPDGSTGLEPATPASLLSNDLLDASSVLDRLEHSLTAQDQNPPVKDGPAEMAVEFQQATVLQSFRGRETSEMTIDDCIDPAVFTVE